jgi:hypothetical protein
MHRFAFGLVLLTTLSTCACVSQTPADLPTPTVTAWGSAGDEDVPDLALQQVVLKAGETLLVSCNDEGGDVAVTWNGTPLHRDASAGGASGFYTMIFSLYSATGGTGDIVATHGSSGDLTINAYVVTNLAPSALDKTSAAQGIGTSPSSGATATTSRVNEFLWGAIGYGINDKATGTWSNGFISGTQFTTTGGIGGVEDGYKTVSSTGAYTAAKTGVSKDQWTALIATYAIAAGGGSIR